MTAILEASAEEEQVRDMGSSGDDSGSFTALVEGPSEPQFLDCSAEQRGKTVVAVEREIGQKSADAISSPANLFCVQHQRGRWNDRYTQRERETQTHIHTHTLSSDMDAGMHVCVCVYVVLLTSIS